MRKRLNYLQVHKNKRPKKLKTRKPNKLQLHLLSITMQSFVHHTIIISQQFNSIAEKSMAILENVKTHIEAINNILKHNKSTHYLKSQRIR